MEDVTAPRTNTRPPDQHLGRSSGPVRLVIAPRVGEVDLEWAAATLALWFGAPLQLGIVEDDVDREGTGNGGGDGAGARTTQPAAYAAIDTLQPLRLARHDLSGELGAAMRASSPAVAVLSADRADLDLAVHLGQPCFLVPAAEQKRLPSGPLVVAVTDSASDVNVVATAGLWAVELGCDVTLIATPAARRSGSTDRVVKELEAMRVSAWTVSVDDVVIEGQRVAEGSGATAFVVASDIDMTEVRATGRAPILVCPASASGAETVLSAASTAPQSGLEALSSRRSLGLLATRTVGRLAYIVDGRPHIVPVNFRVRGTDIILRSLPGSKLDAAEAGGTSSHAPPVCLEVDAIDERAHSGWSVVAHGVFEVIDDPEALAEAWTDAPDPWIRSRSHRWLRLRVSEMTGRQTRR